MNVENLFQDLKNRIDLRKESDGYYIVSPFFFKNTFDSVTFKLYEENDSLFISDCRYTRDFLNDKWLDFKKYGKKIDKIKEFFHIKDGEYGDFIFEFPSTQIVAVEMLIGVFIQGISLIAYVDI